MACVHAYGRPVVSRADYSPSALPGIPLVPITRAPTPPSSSALPCRDEAIVRVPLALPHHAHLTIQPLATRARLAASAALGCGCFPRCYGRRLSSALKRFPVSLCAAGCHRRQAARCPAATVYGIRVARWAGEPTITLLDMYGP
jgi:hypothetical protein